MARPQEAPDSPPTAPLAGRRALVLGGSGGIGAALSRALAARGADLLVHGGSSAARLEASLAAARAARAAQPAPAGAAAPAIEGFLLPIKTPTDFLSRLPELGRFDILAVAFGPFLQKPLHETSAADWERMALLDLALPGALVSALLPGMAERGYGRIALFGGTRTDAIRSYATNTAYAAAKTGLGVLVKSVAAEYADRGIAAFALCPGFVETEYLGEGLKRELAARAPGKRLIPAASIGDFAAELIAAEPCLASGAVINLDAGLRL